MSSSLFVVILVYFFGALCFGSSINGKMLNNETRFRNTNKTSNKSVVDMILGSSPNTKLSDGDLENLSCGVSKDSDSSLIGERFVEGSDRYSCQDTLSFFVAMVDIQDFLYQTKQINDLDSFYPNSFYWKRFFEPTEEIRANVFLDLEECPETIFDWSKYWVTGCIYGGRNYENDGDSIILLEWSGRTLLGKVKTAKYALVQEDDDKVEVTWLDLVGDEIGTELSLYGEHYVIYDVKKKDEEKNEVCSNKISMGWNYLCSEPVPWILIERDRYYDGFHDLECRDVE